MAANTAWMTARLATLDLRIDALETAILNFYSSGAAQEYRYDTGQSALKVERANVAELQRVLDSMINQRIMWCVRMGTSSGAHNSRSGW